MSSASDTTPGTSPSDVRDGEIAVALPERFDASVYFIGRIRTPWKGRKDCPKNARAARETGAVCTLELDPRWVPALKGHRALQPPGRLLLDGQGAARSRRPGAGHLGKGRGTFALRSPVRPNPIAMSVVRLVKVDGNRVEVVGARLPRRHAAPRHQAVLRLDRLDPRCGDRGLAAPSLLRSMDSGFAGYARAPE